MKKFIKITVVALSFFLSYSAASADDKEEALAQAAIKKSGITILKALEKVKEKYPTSIVLDYELEDDNDRFHHEIEMVNFEDEKEYKINVDIITGEFTRETSSSATSFFDKESELEDAEKISKSGFFLRDAIGKIELEEGMIIKEVKFEEEYSVLFFEIEAEGLGKEQKWLVDIESKDLIPTLKKGKYYDHDSN